MIVSGQDQNFTYTPTAPLLFRTNNSKELTIVSDPQPGGLGRMQAWSLFSLGTLGGLRGLVALSCCLSAGPCAAWDGEASSFLYPQQPLQAR